MRAQLAEGNDPMAGALLRKEMQFERDFVKAGGLLTAGCDPTSFGGVLPGYGDQRGIELLVEAGFTPQEAIHIATENGATYLGEDASIGTVAKGKAADLVVLNGNPAAKIEDIENVETVFKDGIWIRSREAKGIRARTCRSAMSAEALSRHRFQPPRAPRPHGDTVNARAVKL
jgi:hypothetical protein